MALSEDNLDLYPDSLPGLRDLTAEAYYAAPQAIPPLTVEQIEKMRDNILSPPLRSQYR